MSDNCNKIIESYFSWLSSRFLVTSSAEASKLSECVIETPFLLPDNDNIKIWVKRVSEEKIMFSDRGTSFDYLYFSGFNIEKQRGHLFVNEILASKNVYWRYDELISESSLENIGETFHLFLSAILEISKLSILAQEKEPEVPFKVTVKNFFDEMKMKYDFERVFNGLATEHKVDFVFNTTGYKLLETVTATKPYRAREVSEMLAFEFEDIKRADNDFIGIVAFDDSRDVWDETAISVLNQYSDYVVPWRDKDKLIELSKLSL